MSRVTLKANLEEVAGIPTLEQFGSLAHHVSTQDGEEIIISTETVKVMNETTDEYMTREHHTKAWRGEWFVVYGYNNQQLCDIVILQKQNDGTYYLSCDDSIISTLHLKEPVTDLSKQILTPTKDQILVSNSLGKAVFNKLESKKVYDFDAKILGVTNTPLE